MTGKPIKAKPIREVKRGVHSIYRVPMIGPITPRLQQPQPANAIGFHHMTENKPDGP